MGQIKNIKLHIVTDIKTNQNYNSIMAMQKRTNVRLPPEVNRILYVRNLPYKISAEELYDIFGKYGAIRQVRLGVTQETRGTAYVVYYQPTKMFQKMDKSKKEDQIDKLKKKYNVAV